MKKIVFFVFTIFLVSCNSFNSSEISLDLIPYAQGEKVGYFNSEGRIVINPQFSSGTAFREGLALVRSAGDEPKVGFIDKEGKYIINAVYKDATIFQEGIAFVVTENEAPAAINKKGETLFTLKDAQEVYMFSEGLSAYSVKDKEKTKWGFVNKEGETVINPQFSKVRLFVDDKCAVKNEEGKWGFIDKKGKLIINYQFDNAYNFDNSYASVELDDKMGVIDENGKYIINPQYKSIHADSDKFLVDQDGKMGWCDKEGKFIINPQFEQAQYFHGQDLAAFESDEKYGYIDKEGKIVINPQFDYALPFVKNKALVRSGDNYGIINKEGKYEVNPQFESVVFDFLISLIENDTKATIANSVKTDYLDVNKITSTVDFNNPEKLSFEDTFQTIKEKLSLNDDDFSAYSDTNGIFEDKEISDNASYSFAIMGRAKGYNYNITENTPIGFVYQLKLKNSAKYKAKNIYKSFKSKLSNYTIVSEGVISDSDVIVVENKTQKVVLVQEDSSTVGIYILSKDFDLSGYLEKITENDI